LRSLSITSPAFENRKLIPKKYTADGEDVNPPINIEGIPDGTKSLVLIVDDPDAPMGTWIHWVMWNIPVRNRIDENSAPGVQGRNSWNRNSYGGPDPPSGTHRYFFKIYAIDTTLSLERTATKNEVEKAMEKHILAKGELVGLYHR
jgi:hypothetical protein